MFFAWSGAVLLLCISVLYLFLAMGQPLGYLAWGGKHMKSLPQSLRVQSAVSIPAQLFAAFVLFKLGGVLSSSDLSLLRIFGYIFMVFFLLNTVMNLLSKSQYERWIMTPIALWIAFSFIYVLWIQ